MNTSDLQIWVGILGTLATIVVSVLGVLNFQRRRDRAATVGTAFKEVVEALASENATRRLAAAILMRRFFDVHAEQGSAGAPYAKEAIAVIAALLRQTETGQMQKVLADGLRFAPSLARCDLQACNFTRAYLGRRKGDPKAVNLADADLFEADLTGASLKGVHAPGAVFFRATLVNTVFTDAVLSGADFRDATLTGARFTGAHLEGADFSGAVDVPQDVAVRLDVDGKVVSVVRHPQRSTVRSAPQ